MTISDIEFEMRINEVAEKDIVEIIEICKTAGFSAERLDEQLQRRGYDKIFTVNYDEYDDDKDIEWEEDDF
ncbi:MAG: hypothetical protein IE885_06275 [Campylobacterales bacterium]|nr:hypothetical protein [Campylobacterales bacterium]